MNTTQSDEINLKELVNVLWEGRWIIVLVTLAFTALAALAAFIVPKKYSASVVIAPVSNNMAGGAFGGLSSLAGQFGGLASLAGITIGDDTSKAEPIAVLQSQTLTQRYIDENELLYVLFAKAWDAGAKRWKVTDPEKMPTLWKANQYFSKKIRSVTEDKKTGMYTMTITWRDPEIAAKWANDLVKMTNDYLREKKVRESERNIAYLQDQAAKTEVVQVRTAIYSILESEIQAVMLARGSDEYALKVIDRAMPPERASFPQPTIWIIGGFLMGGLISVVLVVVLRAWREARAPGATKGS